jgi:hypothetical protein
MAALLELDAESWCSVKGMMAILALPDFTSGQRPFVEVEVSPDIWRSIDRVSVGMGRIVVSSGVNGHRAEWVFPIAAGAPRWRSAYPAPVTTLPGDDGAR